jgi:hypothetical protein
MPASSRKRISRRTAQWKAAMQKWQHILTQSASDSRLIFHEGGAMRGRARVLKFTYSRIIELSEDRTTVFVEASLPLVLGFRQSA